MYTLKILEMHVRPQYMLFPVSTDVKGEIKYDLTFLICGGVGFFFWEGGEV